MGFNKTSKAVRPINLLKIPTAAIPLLNTMRRGNVNRTWPSHPLPTITEAIDG